MKKYTFFILLLCSMMPQIIFAQDPTLFEITWVLESLTIGGEEFLPPSNDEVASVELVFVEANSGIPDTLVGCVCDCFSSIVTFDESANSPSTFMIGEEYVTTLGGCVESENGIFQNRYFTFHEASLTDPFEYVTTFGANEDEISLEVISSNGDIALYSNASLSVSDSRIAAFSIYPNPAQDQLHIQASDQAEVYNVTVFDIQGRALMTTSNQKLDEYPIQVRNWTSGVYFLRLEDQNGNSTTKRFIKN